MTGDVTAEPEAFLQTALAEWLEQYPASKPKLQALAQSLKSTHRDPFLEDLLSTGSPETFRHLGAAIQANQRGEYGAAADPAAAASAAFLNTGNLAGWLRARTEEAYALRFLAKPSQCSQTAEQVIARSERFPWIRSQASIEAAICAVHGGASGRALELLQQGGALASEHSYAELELRANAILSEQRFRLGDLRAPWIDGHRDFQLFWHSASRPNRAHQILMNQATAAEARGLHHAALVLHRSAAEEMSRTPNRLAEFSTLLGVASRALRVADREQAREALERAGRLAPRLTLGAASPRRQALLEVADALADSGDFDSARQYREQAQALTSGEKLPLTEVLDLEVRGRLALHEGNEPAARDAFLEARQIERKRAGQGPTEGKLTQIERRLADLAARRGEPAGRAFAGWDSHRSGFDVDLAQAAARLDSEVFIGFIESDQVIHAWIADRSGVDHRSIPRSAELGAAASELARQCASPVSDIAVLRKNARLVYGLLLEPFGERIARARKVAIAADGALSQIPFSVLEPAGGEPLGFTKDLTRVESLGQYLRRSELPGATEGRRALAIMRPALRPSLAKLYQPLSVGVDLAAVERRWQTAKFSGRDAHLMNIESNARGSAMFLFWGHGARLGGKASLLLAPGPSAGQPEILDAARIQPDSWRACRLAVLAACSSGGSTGSASVDSLVTGLLRAGVRNVVASRWDVDARASAALIGVFLAGAADGELASASLRKAMQATGVREGMSHPYYWAAFENFGAR